MLSVQINEEQIKQLCIQKIEEKLNETRDSYTFWDMKELCRQTNMSLNFIKETFFYDERFPKYRVGKKWLFPEKQCKEFLLKWLSEQPRN